MGHSAQQVLLLLYILFSNLFLVWYLYFTEVNDFNTSTIAMPGSLKMKTKNSSCQTTVWKHTTHEPYVKIVLLSFKNVNHTGLSSGHFCLKGLFPQQVGQFMSEVKMSVGAPVKDSAPLTVPQPDLRHRREECDGLTLSECPDSPFPLTPSTQKQPLGFLCRSLCPQQPPHSLQICPWYCWHVVRRCPSGGR